MSDKIEIKKDTFFKGTIAVLAIILIISIFTGGFGFETSPKEIITDDGGNTAQPVNMNVFLSNSDLYPSIGPSNAKVTVVEFADFQCIWCAFASGLPNWATPSTTNPTAKQMIGQGGDMLGSMGKVEDLAKQGKIRFVYIPVSFFGEESTYTAQAGYCAADQEKFWEMHDAIYKASGDGPTENDGKYSKANLIKIAKEISGLDNTKFSECLNNDATLEKVQQSMTDVRSFGVKGTPTVYVNGQSISPSWASIQSAINSA
ncbi:hypothetical protein AUJ61_03610 [Candidatus Pacearchaeota archaeon CG1_02_30_18]|nr:thioredoxin domain-containing protein [Candidatus Pacearchaeota archaeon]OIO39790.1 MAG: hypothetical protein AUJ61_03610 [Candidatus Pacearchaeota archaeon CG1_02_30_18]PIN71240.1 MAG: hypothetical protein COV77_03140 [Candidatus Pacearchaeota archaeon CG11_big_fil_rev_8_21_14_0_20_30_13]PJA71045.1 MAG: hypothetical protein CO153_03730 [Candidatus Pacearchaeota archaeon CG_4_9_14_3_um_filter_30_11]